MSSIAHEVEVRRCGNCWRVVVRRSDAGPFELKPKIAYADESAATQAARDFISGRLSNPLYAHESWSCMGTKERERKRAEFLATSDEAEASLARGEGLVIATEQDIREFASEVKRRGRARLAAESLVQRQK